MSENRGEQRSGLRLRQLAGEWSPTVDARVSDRVVASGWIEARDQACGAASKRIAIVTAAAVRRDGLRWRWQQLGQPLRSLIARIGRGR